MQLLKERDKMQKFRLKEVKFKIYCFLIYFISFFRKKPKHSILIGTHHKVLSVYMGNIFRQFAKLTHRSYSVGMAEEVDYSADIIFDHHSQFDFRKVPENFVGLHIRRDPRDLAISAAFYHQHSDEGQLHVPRDDFEGRTYQEQINSLPNMTEKILFELGHSAGLNIKQMLDWDYKNSMLDELRYEDLITPTSGSYFQAIISTWPISRIEKKLLKILFEHFSIFNKERVQSNHIRDSKSNQHAEYFTDEVKSVFNEKFPEAVNRLGYKNS